MGRYRDKTHPIVEAVRLTQEMAEANVLHGAPLPEGIVCLASNVDVEPRRVVAMVFGAGVFMTPILPGEWMVRFPPEEHTFIFTDEKFRERFEPE